MYVTHSESLVGRSRAIGLAFGLERRYTKPQILSMYASAVYFGHGYYGLQAASRGYFARDPAGLSWSQASLLAGLPQAPSAYDPLEHLARARVRQRELLAQLVRNGVLSAAQARRDQRDPLHLTRTAKASHA